jgi:hypothetical protein
MWFYKRTMEYGRRHELAKESGPAKVEGKGRGEFKA